MPPPKSSSTQPPPTQQYRLIDYDHGGKTTTITRESADFKKYYLDYNIKLIISEYDEQMMDRVTITVVYDDGRRTTLPLSEMPLMYKSTVQGQKVTLHTTNPWVPAADHFVRRSNIIYPVDASGKTIFTSADTPEIVDTRSRIYNFVEEMAKALEVIELGAGFAKNIAALGGQASFRPHTWVRGMKAPKPSIQPGEKPLPRVGGGSPPPPKGPQLRVIQGGRVGPPATQVSLQRIRGYLQDGKAFQNGKPVFKSIKEFHQYWKSQGFKLLANHPFGPGRQLIYLGPDNVIVKVKTAGYSDGPRRGVATMSLEATNGKGVGWEHALFKVDAKGKILAKNLHLDGVAGPDGGKLFKLPADHPDRKKGMEYGFLPNDKTLTRKVNDKGEVSYNVGGLTGLEVIHTDSSAPPNKQAWADRGHLDMASGFNGDGAESLTPDK